MDRLLNWFRDLKLAPKLFAAFGAVIVLIVVLSFSAFRGLASLNAATTDIANHWMVDLSVAQDMRATLSSYRLKAFHLVLRTSDETRLAARTQQEDLAFTFDDLLDTLLLGAISDAEKAEIAALRKDWEAYQAHTAEVVSAYEMGFADEALDLFLGENRQKYDALAVSIQERVTEHMAGSTAAREDAAETYAAARNTIFVTLFISILLAAALAFLIARVIARGVDSALQVAHAVAGGKLETASTPRAATRSVTCCKP